MRWLHVIMFDISLIESLLFPGRVHYIVMKKKIKFVITLCVYVYTSTRFLYWMLNVEHISELASMIIYDNSYYVSYEVMNRRQQNTNKNQTTRCFTMRITYTLWLVQVNVQEKKACVLYNKSLEIVFFFIWNWIKKENGERNITFTHEPKIQS